MKRQIKLALLLIGVASIFAIAVSIQEPVRMLSHAERDALIGGGCYDCPDCTDDDYDCGGTTGCSSEGGGCDDDGKRSSLNPVCESGTEHDGNCGSAEYYDCYKEKACTCYNTNPGWGCQESDWSEPVKKYKVKDPC